MNTLNHQLQTARAAASAAREQQLQTAHRFQWRLAWFQFAFGLFLTVAAVVMHLLPLAIVGGAGLGAAAVMLGVTWADSAGRGAA